MPVLIGTIDGRPVAGWYQVFARLDPQTGEAWPEIVGRFFSDQYFGYNSRVAIEALGLGRLGVQVLRDTTPGRYPSHGMTCWEFHAVAPLAPLSAIDPDILRLPVSEVLRDAGMDDAADKVLRIAAMLGVDVGGRSS